MWQGRVVDITLLAAFERAVRGQSKFLRGLQHSVLQSIGCFPVPDVVNSLKLLNARILQQYCLATLKSVTVLTFLTSSKVREEKESCIISAMSGKLYYKRYLGTV
jgi:hypothetical protein